MNVKQFGAAAIVAVSALGIGLAVAQPAPQQDARPGERRTPRPMAMFTQIDADKDGRLTPQEVQTWLAARFAAVDTDKNGSVSLDEAKSMRPGRAGAEGKPRRTAGLEMRFRALDADSDGAVTLEEVQPAVAAIFRALDANGDGVITQEEARAARPHHRHHRRG